MSALLVTVLCPLVFHPICRTHEQKNQYHSIWSLKAPIDLQVVRLKLYGFVVLTLRSHSNKTWVVPVRLDKGRQIFKCRFICTDAQIFIRGPVKKWVDSMEHVSGERGLLT